MLIIGNTFLDYPDKESHALIVYMSGCDFACLGCQNPEMQKDITHKNNTPKLYHTLLEQSKKYGNTNKLVLSGGDPLSKHNLHFTKSFLSLNIYFDVCIYTGHSLYTVPKDLRNFKYLKIGRYMEDLKQEQIKNDEFIQFASSNQMLVDGNYNVLTTGGKYIYV